jgi:hypothetical protein
VSRAAASGKPVLMIPGQTISIKLLPPAVVRAPPALAPPIQTGGSLLSRIAGGPGAAANAANVPLRGGRGGRGG